MENSDLNSASIAWASSGLIARIDVISLDISSTCCGSSSPSIFAAWSLPIRIRNFATRRVFESSGGSGPDGTGVVLSRPFSILDNYNRKGEGVEDLRISAKILSFRP
jgi:hypothetical protein